MGCAQSSRVPVEAACRFEQLPVTSRMRTSIRDIHDALARIRVSRWADGIDIDVQSSGHHRVLTGILLRPLKQ